jgi:3-oxoacyl-[acyl-carrier protein] reductase
MSEVNVVFSSLKDRVAIVTGAGQGIGRAFAKAFADAGAIAVIAERNEKAAASVSAEIMKTGGRALAVTTDIGDPASIDEMVEVVEDEFGRIDILVNNAAIFSTLQMRPFEQIPLDEWNEVLKINVTGQMLCARAVLPAMRRAKWGRIVNMSSGAVTLGRPGYLHYIVEIGADRHEPLDGARAWPRRHHRQRHPARRGVHRDRAQDHHPGAERTHHRHAVHPARGDAG